MKLTLSCPICAKPLIETFAIGVSDTEVLQGYKCGHSFIKELEALKTVKTHSVDNSGKEAREYQKEGVKFIIKSEFNCIIGDQMRLGKTPQALLALQSYYDERTPCLIIVRSANLYQWIREYKVWTDTLPLGIYPIVGTKAFIPPGFSSYIISMDTFSRAGMVENLLAFGFKLVIVDEAHSFKNTESKRSQALVQFLHDISETKIEKTLSFTCPMCSKEWKEDITIKVNLKFTTKESLFQHRTACPSCKAVMVQACRKLDEKARSSCGVIMLSGTAIKNRADEYFVPLNIVAPERFSSLERFRREWLEQDSKGKWSRVNHRRYDAFKEAIKPYVLRREKEDVFTNLPKINRIFTIVEISDERLKKAYNQVLDVLEIEMAKNPNLTFFQSIGELTKLRQIAGLAVVPWACDYAETMLMDSDKAKLAIGVHHYSIRDTLKYQLSQFGVMTYDGSTSDTKKDWFDRNYSTSPERIAIIGMLAGGVGKDFHEIDNALVLERQWSSADEEQFEFRFYNPDNAIKSRPTNIEYLIPKGTIAEWFYDMVEEKRVIFGETIGTSWDVTTDATSFRQLLEQTVSHRL